MTFELFVARRYLRAKRKGLFAFVTSAIGVAGVTIGVAALIATLSVMNGFQTDIQRKIVGAQSHLTIAGPLDAAGLATVQGALKEEPAVVASAPFALGQAILTGKGRSLGIVFKGIDPDLESNVNQLKSFLTSGDWERLKVPSPGLRPSSHDGGGRHPKGAGEGTPAVIVGEELARSLGVWEGDKVTLVSPQGVTTPLGVFPRMQDFQIVGTVKTGYYEFDATFAYMHIRSAADFLGTKDSATALAVKLSDIDAADDVAARMQGRLGYAYTVRTFSEMNRTLFAALKLEKAVMFLILALIVLVATFNIASNLLLLSTEKARDVGILRALGMTRNGVRSLFWCVGALIGGVGVALGTLLGIVVSWAIGRFPIVELPPDIYYLSRVPVDIQAGDVAAVAATAFALCMVATLYPAWRASQVDPVEAIHYG